MLGPLYLATHRNGTRVSCNVVLYSRWKERSGVPQISIEMSGMDVGYHFHFSSSARTNHMVPLHHKAAKECDSIICCESQEAKIFREQC